MKKKTKKTLWVILGCLLVAGASVGVISALNDNEKTPEETIALYTSQVGESKAVVDEENYDVTLKGHFTDENGKALQYSFTLEVDGNEDFVTDHVTLGTTFTNFNEIVLTIEGHEGLIESLDVVMFASDKNVVEAKAYLGLLRMGKVEVGTGMKAYNFEPLYASDSEIKIKITTEDPEATFNLNSIIINANVEKDEETSSETESVLESESIEAEETGTNNTAVVISEDSEE